MKGYCNKNKDCYKELMKSKKVKKEEQEKKTIKKKHEKIDPNEKKRMITLESEAEKSQINNRIEQKRMELFKNALPFIIKFISGEISLEELENKVGKNSRDITYLLAEFNPELQYSFERTLDISYKMFCDKVKCECLNICNLLKNGVNVNNNKDEYTYYDFFISTDLKLKDFNILTTLDVSEKELKTIKKFSHGLDNQELFSDCSEIYEYDYTFVINGVERKITDDEKLIIVDLLLSKNIPLYKSLVSKLFKRYVSYGINDKVIPYEEVEIIKLKRTQ